MSFTNPPPDPTDIPTALQGEAPSLVVDQKLLDRALKRIKGLIKGNGANPDDVRLIDTKEVRMYRFAAQTRLKMVANYGVRPEIGKNTKAELATSEEDFRRILNTVPHDTATVPERRQPIVDTIFARSDKGFGIKEQQMSFHTLRRYIVRHEKCIHCKSSGYLPCGTCHGTKTSRCVNCQGRRHSVCPKCRGSGQVHTQKGMIPCEFCHHDGRITCPKCAGRGSIRCRICGGTGNMACQPCGKTGWVSHLATVDISAQIKFDYDRENLPPLLVSHLDNNPSRLVEKNDIEVALATGWAKDEDTVYNTDKATPETKLEDTITLDYSVMCPVGPVRFAIGTTEYDAILLGFQARLLDAPHFLDTLTTDGQDALLRAAKARHIAPELLAATRFALIQDILVKVLMNRNLRKAHHILCDKYTAGIAPDKLGTLVRAADLALKRSTRIASYTGVVAGFGLYTILYAMFTFGLTPENMAQHSLPELLLWGLHALCPVLGYFVVTLLTRHAVIFAQTRILSGVISSEILRKHVPLNRMFSFTILAGVSLATLVILGYAFLSGTLDIPFLATKTPQ